MNQQEDQLSGKENNISMEANGYLNNLGMNMEDPYASVLSHLGGLGLSDERMTGYPQPQLYDQHYINKYAYPKGLKTNGKMQDEKNAKKKSLYDMRAPNNRKGFSGWKLTKRPNYLAPDMSLP